MPADARTLRRLLAIVTAHADARHAWQLDVYATIGGLSMRRDDDEELAHAYHAIAMSGPCNWNWMPVGPHPITLAVLGREPVRGEDVRRTMREWTARPAAEWPDALPVPEAPDAR